MYKINVQSLGLKPREKLEVKGVDALSNSELLAIIFNTGNRKESVLDISKRVIKDYGVNALSEVREYYKLAVSLEIGKVKSMQLLAVLELGRRIYREQTKKRPLLNTAKKVSKFMNFLKNKKREELRALYLNSRQVLIRNELIAMGAKNFLIIEPKEVYSGALECGAQGVILVHNHPSGLSKPSDEDREVTLRMKQAGVLLGLDLLDHIIIGKYYYSFYENQELNKL